MNFYWKINPKVIGVPRINGTEQSLKTQNNFQVEYDINKEQFTLYDFIDAEYLDNLGGGVIGLMGDIDYLGVGTYDLSIIILNTSNYVWSNYYDFPMPGMTPTVSGTVDADVNVEVVRAAVKYPVLVREDGLEFNVEYNFNGVFESNIEYAGYIFNLKVRICVVSVTDQQLS